jgi:hypothetical protein
MFVNAKMIPAEPVQGIWKGGIKESSIGGEFKNDIFNLL